MIGNVTFPSSFGPFSSVWVAFPVWETHYTKEVGIANLVPMRLDTSGNWRSSLRASKKDDKKIKAKCKISPLSLSLRIFPVWKEERNRARIQFVGIKEKPVKGLSPKKSDQLVTISLVMYREMRAVSSVGRIGISRDQEANSLHAGRGFQRRLRFMDGFP